MNRRLTSLLAPATIFAMTGLALGLGAIGEPPDKDQPRDKTVERTRREDTRRMNFVQGTKMTGLSVKNSEDKTLGSVDDMVIDRGTGRITYVVLKTGAVLGMGGKLVAVPYNTFGWDNAEKHAMLAATPEEIKTWPEFVKERWSEGPKGEKSLVCVLAKDYYDTSNSPWPTEAKSDSTEFKGTIKAITRRPMDSSREEIVVTVTPERGGQEQEVILGPSWYAFGNNTVTFYRESPIEVNVFHVTREGHPVMVARSAKIGGQEVVFYDSQGRAVWTPSASTGQVCMVSPFVLYSDLKGRHVDCRGEKCGKVDNIVVECSSGRAAFLVIDPDKNVLGIADEDRLVPWNIMMTSTDGKVHLDASKSMISSGPTMPKDLKTLGMNADYKRIYAAYDVPAMSFEKSRSRDRDTKDRP